MIAWLQNNVEKHYKWLFGILLVIIITAFVFTIGATPGLVSGKKLEEKFYFGYNLNDHKQIQNLATAVNISHFINSGQVSSSPQDLQINILRRPLLLSLANDLQLDTPNEFELIDFIKSKPIFHNDKNSFDDKKYQDFLSLLKNNNIHESLVRSVLSEDYRIEQVISSLAGPANTLPYEAKLLLKNKRTQWSLNLLSFDTNSFSPSQEPSEQSLRDFYTTNSHKFPKPPHAKASYIHLPLQPFLSQVPPPSNDLLEKEFNKNPKAFASSKDDPAPTFDAVKDKVSQKVTLELAKRLSSEAAYKIIQELYQHNIPFNSKEFSLLLQEHKLPLNSLPEFSSDNLPKNAPLPKSLLLQAFNLDSERYYSEVAVNDKGAFVLFLQSLSPQSYYNFDEVPDKIKHAYLTDQAQKNITSHAKSLHQSLLSGLKSNKSIDELASSLHLSTKKYENISLATPPDDLPLPVIDNILNLNKNDLSQPITSKDHIHFAYILSRKIPQLPNNDPEIDSTLSTLAPIYSNFRADGLLGELISKAISPLHPQN